MILQNNCVRSFSRDFFINPFKSFKSFKMSFINAMNNMNDPTKNITIGTMLVNTVNPIAVKKTHAIG